VVAATSGQHVPLSGSGWGTNRQTSMDEGAPTQNAAQYMMTADALEALGVTLESGRSFTEADVEYPEAFGDWPDKVIVTRAYADALFPDGGGRPGAVIYDGLGNPQTIVGVIGHMQGAWVGWDKLDQVLLVPTVRVGSANYYIVRTEPGQRDRLMPEVEALLAGMNDGRVIKDLRTLQEIRDESYMGDRGMAVLLAAVVAMMILVTGVGIVGLASLAVRQRTKQIGTRRALGARKRDIVRYFMLENWLITTVGVTIGAFLTIGINYWLVTSFELERLEPRYVIAGILALWSLGLLAVLGPARKAAQISPAIATRTV
jgi:putative ABC transport system permease protein